MATDDNIKAGFEQAATISKQLKQRLDASAPVKTVVQGTAVPAGTPDGTFWVEYV